MAHSQSLIALDVGEKRIGVARADTSVRIAVAHSTLLVDGTEFQQIQKIMDQERAGILVVGYPRNQSGEATKQTAYVEHFVEQLATLGITVEFQDESVTSVRAEELLKAQRKPYSKGDIDAVAASLILQDYLELHYGRV